MREMKSSGLPWVDNIPENWEIARGKEILTLLSRPVEPRDGVITCFRDGEVTLRSKRRELGFTFSTQETGYQGIEPGDLVIHGMDGFAGSIGISDSRGKATPVLNVMDSNQNKKYLMYYFRAIAKAGYFESVATGIRVRTCDTNWNKISVTPCLIPPLDEQSRIASFLDSCTAKIDDSIARYKALSDKLDEYRKAVITKAVTEGVRGERNMKKCEIPWLPKIPFEWSATRFKFAGKCSHGLSYKPEDICGEEGYLVIRASNIQNGNLAFEDNVFVKNIPESLKIKKGDIIICGTNGSLNLVGKSAMAKEDMECAFGSFMLRYRCYHNPAFYNYMLTAVIPMHRALFATTTINQITMSMFNNMMIPCPTIDEQTEIVAYLDKKCFDIDRSKAKIETIIKKLEEYKKSLIYNAVTGKIEC